MWKLASGDLSSNQPGLQELSEGGHYARACGAGKPFASSSSITAPVAKQNKTALVAKQIEVVPMATRSGSPTSGTPGSAKIFSIHNPEKLELVQVEIEIRDGTRRQIEALPDTGANITAFQPEILPKLGLSNKDMKKATWTPKSADGSALRTLGSVEVRISKLGHTTEFLTAYVIKNLQQPILSRQVLRELGIIPQEFPFVQLSIGNGANFGGKSIEKLEEALRQARAKRGIHVSAASTTPRIELGHGPELDKIANEFSEVFDNTKILTMNGGFYTIELEENAIPFNKGSSRTVPEPCMEKLKTELELQLGLGLIEQVPAGKKASGYIRL
jgi:hypothetical protein